MLAVDLRVLKVSKASKLEETARSKTEDSRDKLELSEKPGPTETLINGPDLNYAGGLQKKLTSFMARLDGHLAQDLETLKDEIQQEVKPLQFQCRIKHLLLSHGRD